MVRKSIFHGLGAAMLALALAGCAAQEGHRSTGQYTDDITTTARVREALLKTPDLRSNTIQVETYQSVVQLSGFADNEDSAASAVGAARGVAGVKEIRNNILVRNPQ